MKKQAISGDLKNRIKAVLIALAFQMLLFSPMINGSYAVGNLAVVGDSTVQNEVYSTESVFARERCNMQCRDNVTFNSVGPASAFIPGALLIKIAPDTKIHPLKSARGLSLGEASLDSLMQKYGVYSIQKIFKATSGKLSRWYKIEFPQSIDVDSVVKEFKKNMKIECAQPSYICSFCMAPDDYYYDQQWALNNIGQNYLAVERNPGSNNDEQVWKNGTYDSDIDAPEAWNITLGRKEVVVAVIDTGVDYNHEDIAGNIWVNPGEDLNHNGIVDSSDFDGNDTDGNGYIDDIRGYDFYYNDTDPMDFAGHGTHIAGTIAALTDNSIGVAGVAGNVSIMPLKIGSDGWDLNVSIVARAIEYAADNGAKILSNSWGFTVPEVRDRAIEDAIVYAYDKGCVVVFSAGNENSSARYYPAAGYYVVAVAATDSTDQRTWFSNYGDWVDICAPGHDILSLRASGTDMYAPDEPNVHIVGDKYYIASGTSMAAPHVSGVAALIASEFPQASNVEIVTRLLSTADNIDELNPLYYGLLGTGRVNAYKALSTAQQPKLVFESLSLDDYQGDGDGVVDPGETVQLTVTLKNLWIGATNIVANLTSNDPHVTILEGASSFGNISTGSTGDSETPYTVAFSSDIPYEHTLFKISIVADNGYADTDYFQIQIPVFTDVTSAARVEGSPDLNSGMDLAWGDYDNDGWLDIYTSINWNVHIYHNDRNGTFTDVTSQAGLDKEVHAGGICGAWGDYDNDGNLDLYVGDWYPYPHHLYRNNGNGTFTDVTQQAGVGCENHSGDAYAVIFGDYNNDGWLDIYVVHRMGTNFLYRNNGDGTFTYAPEAGLGGNYYGISAAFFDYDNDGLLDMYLTNDGPCVLYRNNGDGTFTNVTQQAGVAGWQNGYAFDVAVADYDNDGFLDMHVSYYPGVPGSILYHNNGNGTFEDKTLEAGVGGVFASKVLFGDYDNDGHQDLFATFCSFDWSYPNWLFRNNGDGTFTDVSNTIENNIPAFTWGAGFGDYNNDGYIDLYLSRFAVFTERNTLYRNNLGVNNWLIIKTIGEISNRDGIGAKVKVKTGTQWQTQEVSASSGNSIPLEFGLGSHSKADLVKVIWPSGAVSEISNVQANQTINIFEAHDVAVTNVKANKNVVGQGYTLNVNVTVMNQGSFTETFNVTLYANTTSIAFQEITLTSGNFITITFTWNTTGFAYGNYTISAKATPVPGETTISDNTLDAGIVIVTIPGDVNGDGTVDVYDKLALIHAFGSSPGDPKWNPNCDINGDNEIDVFDLLILKSNLGKSIPIPDIAVTNITLSKTVVGQKYLLYVNVTVENQGEVTETFNLTVYANSTIIGTQTVTLMNAQFTTETFTWNTTGVAYGNYTISATAVPVPRETDTTDNTLIDGTVFVTIPGDVDGDGTVNVFDQVLFNNAFGSSPGDPNWNPNCDIDSDNAINIFDLLILRKNWGKSI